MQVISKKEAKVMGLQHFFTGKPCKRRRGRKWR